MKQADLFVSEIMLGYFIGELAEYLNVRFWFDNKKTYLKNASKNIP